MTKSFQSWIRGATGLSAVTMGISFAAQSAEPVAREPITLKDVVRRVVEFNSIDPHQLPIANIANHGHPTYNKYGIAQRNLLAATPLFPKSLQEMPWVETELLVKTLAQILINHRG